jgi:hypothetical protein
MGAAAAPAAEMTSSDVYVQAERIGQEIELVRRHYNVTVHNPVAPVEADLKFRHVWQKAYMILAKLSVFRHKHGLAGFAPLETEPEARPDPRINWSQTQRILTEIRIIKFYLGILGETGPVAKAEGKRPVDVFNKLNQIAYDMDALNGETIAASAVYAEAIRINEDIDAIIRRSGTIDNAVPPVRYPGAQPSDALAAAFGLLAEVQHLQRRLGITTTDFSAFSKSENVVQADVFNMIGMCLAELQLIKVQLGMKYNYTPPAEYIEGKSPAEVMQLLGYEASKLRLVNPR